MGEYGYNIEDLAMTISVTLELAEVFFRSS
jgi:hypothetical protein